MNTVIILWFFRLNDYEFFITFWKVINDNLKKKSILLITFSKKDQI